MHLAGWRVLKHFLKKKEIFSLISFHLYLSSFSLLSSLFIFSFIFSCLLSLLSSLFSSLDLLFSCLVSPLSSSLAFLSCLVFSSLVLSLFLCLSLCLSLFVLVTVCCCGGCCCVVCVCRCGRGVLHVLRDVRTARLSAPQRLVRSLQFVWHCVSLWLVSLSSLFSWLIIALLFGAVDADTPLRRKALFDNGGA